MDKNKRLYRVNDNKVIAGVCTGLSEYLGMDVNIIRILFVISILVLSPIVVLVYLILALALPYGDELIKKSETVEVHNEDEYAYDENDYKL